MKIYTSYFSNGKALNKANIAMIGIALYPPKWFTGRSWKTLAPSYSILFTQNQTREQYTERYKREILARLNANYVVQELERMSGGKDVALCCFEKPGDFCHRHILAEWLTQQTGIEVKEYEIPAPPKQPTLLDDMF